MPDTQDRAQAILAPLPIPERLKATAWDAYDQAADPDDLAKRIAELPIPQEAKAALWDAKVENGPEMNTAWVNGHRVPVEPTWTDRALEALPTAGGMVGGAIGGIGGTAFGLGIGGVPGAVGGAALGGAAGEAVKRLAEIAFGRGPVPAPADVASGIGQQAAVQGASEIVGQGVMRGAKAMGKGLMDFAVRPAPTLAEEFPDIAGTMIRERLPVGRVLPGAKSGSQRAKAALRESGAVTRGLLNDAEQAGTTFGSQTVAQPTQDLAAEIAKQPLSVGELKRLSGMFMEYMQTKPESLTPNQVKDLKQAAQSVAKPIFRAIRQGQSVGADQSLIARFNNAIATGAKGALETIPGVAESEGRTQSLIGATRAIRRAEARRLPLIAEVAAGTMAGGAGALVGGREGAAKGVGAAMLTRALLSPRTTSRIALMLTQDQVEQALRQMPRAAAFALLRELETQAQPPVPPGR